MENTVLLDVRNLKKHFPVYEGILIKRRTGAIHAINGINFTIKKSETLGLVGESGCGKSTTARCIAQLYKPTDGQIIFKGNDLCTLSREDLLRSRMNIQMIFQDPYASLNPRMTAGAIISEPMVIYKKRGMLDLTKKDILSRTYELMEKAGLARYYYNRYPHEFSGGQRQRIGIARALALHPGLILADEPVSALDVSIQSQILNLLKDLQEEFELTFLFIAHDLAVIEHISTTIAVMYLGVIVEIAPTDDLYKEPLHPYTKALHSAVPVPDPEIEKKRKRIILTGDVPSPDKEQHGCYFYSRCPNAMPAKCKDNIPPLKEIKKGHYTACFLYFDP
ncbi:MAG: ATP-binding cassette domain-containing protein [Spirochaetales bacterium]|nr:ATP-binding cassette domain-containing protein [Spirochaetales bacterium]